MGIDKYCLPSWEAELFPCSGCDSQEEKENPRCQNLRLSYLNESRRLSNDRLTERGIEAVVREMNNIATSMRGLGREDPPYLIL